jgi:TPP-dependent pyruvate/acetoin dehydrogenase alpha subunit
MATRKQKPSASAPAGGGGFSLISDEKLLQLYTTMVKCRMIEERARSLFEPKNLLERKKLAGNGGGAVGQEAGQEAAVVGVAIDLGPEDRVVPLNRSLIVGFGLIASFVRGAPLEEVFRSQMACAAGLDLAAQLDIATGAALINKTKKNGKIAVVFLDGEEAEPVFRPDFWPDSCSDALHAAGVHRLPILFVRLSSLPAVLGKRKAQKGIDAHAERDVIARQAEACGVPFIAVDGNDAVAVYRVATEAIAHARKGNGATFIACETAGCKAHDPILKMEAYLTRKGLFSEKLKRENAASFTQELKAAIATANQSKKLASL